MSVDARALCKYIFRWLPRSNCFSVKHALCAPYAHFGMQSVQMELWTTTLLSHFNIDRYQVCAHECTFNQHVNKIQENWCTVTVRFYKIVAFTEPKTQCYPHDLSSTLSPPGQTSNLTDKAGMSSAVTSKSSSFIKKEIVLHQNVTFATTTEPSNRRSLGLKNEGTDDSDKGTVIYVQ